MMPRNVSHIGYAIERAGDTSTARSYRTSFAERERLHLRQELLFGRRASQSNSVPAILAPVKRLVSKARLKWDTAYYQRQLGRLPVAKPWRWEEAKSQSGYDAQEPLTVLAHAWACWGFWLEVFRRPSNGDHRYVTASVLARRALRGWRRWTIQEKLLAPTWRQVRLNARMLPPLPTPAVRTRPRTSTTTSESHRQTPLATHYYGASPWRYTLEWYEEQEKLSNDIDQWRKTQDSMLQEFDRLHPGRVWLRSWYTVDFPTHARPDLNPTVLWYHFRPPSMESQSFAPHSDWLVRNEQIMSETRARYSRPPPKFRYVVCHYGQPFSWHWIEAAPTFGPMYHFKPYGPATGWQESVLFTIVGSSSGSFTAQGHSFRARSVHPGLFNTTASVPPAIIESAEYYSSASVEVEDFTGAGELTSFTQRSEQTLISHQSDEDCFEMYSSEEDDDEDSVAPVCMIQQLSNPECFASRIT